MKARHLILAAVTAVVLGACSDDGRLFDTYRSLHADGWRRSDTVLFNIPADILFAATDGELHLRVADDYPFSNITMVVTTTAGDSLCHRDTVECRLADADGRLSGTGYGFKDYTADMPLPAAPQRASLMRRTTCNTDTLGVAVCHIMRRETLPGLAAVGLTLRRRP